MHMSIKKVIILVQLSHFKHTQVSYMFYTVHNKKEKPVMKHY